MTFTARRLQRLLVGRGGFTVHARSGRLLRDGIAVGTERHAALAFPLAAWCDDRVEGWLAAHRGGAGQAGLHLGGWWDRDLDHVHLDVVRVFPTHHRRWALHAGRAAGQRAVYDLTHHELLHVGEAPASPTPADVALVLGTA